MSVIFSSELTDDFRVFYNSYAESLCIGAAHAVPDELVVPVYKLVRGSAEIKALLVANADEEVDIIETQKIESADALVMRVRDIVVQLTAVQTTTNESIFFQ